jgi:excisionase family DNA binding protein
MDLMIPTAIAAKLLGYGLRHVNKLVESGAVEAKRVKGKNLIPLSEVQRYGAERNRRVTKKAAKEALQCAKIK